MVTVVSRTNPTTGQHELYMQERQENMHGRIVHWFRDPGEYENLRLITAVALGFLLTISIIGVPFVILAYYEWNQQVTEELVGNAIESIRT